jgi:hypothetical protein
MIHSFDITEAAIIAMFYLELNDLANSFPVSFCASLPVELIVFSFDDFLF